MDQRVSKRRGKIDRAATHFHVFSDNLLENLFAHPLVRPHLLGIGAEDAVRVAKIGQFEV